MWKKNKDLVFIREPQLKEEKWIPFVSDWAISCPCARLSWAKPRMSKGTHSMMIRWANIQINPSNPEWLSLHIKPTIIPIILIADLIFQIFFNLNYNIILGFLVLAAASIVGCCAAV